MKEVLTASNLRSSELTRASTSPRLDRGANFMPEPGKDILVKAEELLKGSQAGKIMAKPQAGGVLAESASPLQRKFAEEGWRAYYKKQGMDIDQLPADERRTIRHIIDSGILPSMSGGEDPIPTVGITRPELLAIANEINHEAARLGTGRHFSPEDLNEHIKRVRDQLTQGIFTTDPERNQAYSLIDTLKTRIDQEERRIGEERRAQREREVREQRSERFGLYLQREDIETLTISPQQWLDQQFDVIYRNVQQGQELNSPVFQNIQTVVGEAIRYLQYHKPEALEHFQEQFNNRLNLMIMRTVMGRGGMEQIQGAAMALGAHGLFIGFGMEGRKAEAMYNRLHELLEDERLKLPLNHVTSELAYGLQERVIREELDFLEKQMGLFYRSGVDEDALKTIRDDIVRTVRTAYDVFVASQRMAVIVARGRRLSKADAFYSDPIAGPLNVYNMEDLLFGKFSTFTAEGQELLREIKLDLAEEHIREKMAEAKKLRGKAFLTDDQRKELEYYESLENINGVKKEELGRRLFRDFFAVPDFFSSGWRIKGVVQSIDERLVFLFGEEEGMKRAKDLALFMRLKAIDPENPWTGYGSKREVWQRIAECRPDEIIRIYRERALKEGSGGDPELAEKLDDFFGRDIFRQLGISSYDAFKDKYGQVIRLLRDRGYKEEFKQLNITGQGLNQEERRIIAQYFGDDQAVNEIQAIQTIFREMSEFGKNAIDDLLYNEKFADIYTRTIAIDDALLGELEKDKIEKPDPDHPGQVLVKELTPLSKKYANDPGKDALPRMWNDTNDAVMAGQALAKFFTSTDAEERIKSAVEFASKTTYNGMKQRAKAIRFTIGTFLGLSKKSYFWDAIGLDKLPFDIPMSEVEKIFGSHATPMSRDQIKAQIDKIRDLLVAAAGEDDPGDENLTPRELMHKREDKMKKAYKTYDDLKALLGVTKKDLFKLGMLRALIFIVLATFGESINIAKSTIDIKK